MLRLQSPKPALAVLDVLHNPHDVLVHPVHPPLLPAVARALCPPPPTVFSVSACVMQT